MLKVTDAELVHVEINNGTRLRRAWSRVTDRDALLEPLVADAMRQRTRSVSSSAIAAPLLLGLPVGFVYLQRNAPIDDVACEYVELLAWNLAGVTERFDNDFARRGLDDELRLRERSRVIESVESNHGNLTAAARELRVSRTRIYRASRRER